MFSRLTNRAVTRSELTTELCSKVERCLATQATAEFKQKQQQQVEHQSKNDKSSFSEEILSKAKPYTEIPGPTTWQFIRGVLPGGRYRTDSFFDMFLDMNKQFGQIYRMPGLFGNKEIIVAMNPADYETIFRNEGTWPYRRSFAFFDYYHEKHNPNAFGNYSGLIWTNGEDWGKTRKAANPILMQPRNARLYLNQLADVNEEFLQRIREVRDPETLEMPTDFEEDIRRLILESIGIVALNKHLGLLHKNRDSAESKTILDSLRRFPTLAFEVEVIPSLAKYIKTSKFKELMTVLDSMTNFCTKYIQEALARVAHDDKGNFTSELGQEKSVLEKLARVNRQMAVVVAMDLLIAGVDTTNTSLSGILLSLAKNPEKQEKLFEELKEMLPTKDSQLTSDTREHLPYLRACIKEGIRLHPIGAGTMRRMPHDIVLSGYRIPAGTDVTTGANLQMWQEPYVPRAKEFLPERWLRDDDSELVGDISTPFMYIPFGFGRRSCAGKRIVDLIMELAVSRLVRNFHIEYNYPLDNAFKGKFFVHPNVPLKFKFVERDELRKTTKLTCEQL